MNKEKLPWFAKYLSLEIEKPLKSLRDWPGVLERQALGRAQSTSSQKEEGLPGEGFGRFHLWVRGCRSHPTMGGHTPSDIHESS
jgi:hypothetical protein